MTLTAAHDTPAVEAKAAAPAAEARGLDFGDLEAVGRLFQRTFRGVERDEPAPQELKDALATVYLKHPWREGSTPAMVLAAPDGRIDAFVGSQPLRLVFRGRPIRASVPGALMTRAPKEDPMAAPRVLRKILQGGQDLSVSDTANSSAMGMWRALGARTLPVASMEYHRILRPLGYGAGMVLRRLPGGLGDKLAPHVAGLLARFSSGKLAAKAPRPADAIDKTVDDEVFLDAFDVVLAEAPLAIAPERSTRAWYLQRVAARKGRGPLQRHVVTDAKGGVLGVYLAFVTPGANFYVLDCMARAGAAPRVVNSMMATAADARCVEVIGRTRPHLFEALSDASCMFVKHCTTVVATRDEELLAALVSGEAEVGGFIGGMWSRLDSDRFD